MSDHDNILFGRQELGIKYKALFLSALLFWTLIVGCFLYWSLNKMDEDVLESARIQARASIDKDILYRRWNALHGGLYAPVGTHLAPNKYLKAKNRDIETKNGTILTKINPSYMTRQIYELGAVTSDVKNHITSLNPIRPENKADRWESSVLKQQNEKPAPVYSVQNIFGKQYMRLMVPMITETSCLSCHAIQGYKIGDVRGGISSSVPLEPLFAEDYFRRQLFVSVIILSWLLGCFVIRSFDKIKKTEIMALANERKYRTLVDTMSEGIVFLDNSYKITFCNPPFANMLGYAAGDLLQTSFDTLVSSNFEIDFLKKISGEEQEQIEPFELNLSCKSGGQVCVLFSPKFSTDSYNMPLGLLAVTTDISKLKKMEKEVLRQQRFNSVGMLAGGVALEIGSPLKYLESNAAFLRRSFNTFNQFVKDQMIFSHSDEDSKFFEAKLKEYEISRILRDVPATLDENENSILRIADITASIKALAGAEVVKSEPEDINSLIRQCVDTTSRSWSKIAEIDLNLSDNISVINCISSDIKQVLSNVIINAADAIKVAKDDSNGREIGHIRISTGIIGKELRIVISDDGCGIADDYLSKIFDPFFTTKKPGKGTGQGLAVALRIMNEHGGDIVAESLSGRGAVFILSLPA